MRKAELSRMREIGEPYAVKAARTVREEAGGKGLALVGTSLAAYFTPLPFALSNTERFYGSLYYNGERKG